MDTPRTDAAYLAAYKPEQIVSPVNQMRDLARQLERELAALEQKRQGDVRKCAEFIENFGKQFGPARQLAVSAAATALLEHFGVDKRGKNRER